MADRPAFVPLAAGGMKAPGQQRIEELKRMVATAKAKHLSPAEALIKGFNALLTLPFLGLTGYINIPANTKVAIFRFGKLDALISTPGLHWVAPGYERMEEFAGAQTHETEKLSVIDAAGNPIIVKALLEYSIVDPAALHIALAGNRTVLFNMAEQVVREACSRLPLVGEPGHDIRSQTHELGDAMVRELSADAVVFGIHVLRLVIVESRYAPEIAASMLAKQQAAAMVQAREQIVAGALNVVGDTLLHFPTLSNEAREKLVCNLLVTLTSHTQATPVLPLSS